MHTIGENYHIYNRGAHKALIFHDKSDYERFLNLMYSKNRLENSVLSRSTLVDIFAYCLMPNHFHIGIKEIHERGTERFIHRLCTAYVMYYNRKYKHSGTIFQGQYKHKHVHNDEYLQYLIQYIHLNPFGIDEPDLMKTAKSEYLNEAVGVSKKYEYSSFRDYLGEQRPQRNILCPGLPSTRVGLG